jgi:hypothetical protein
VASNRAWFGCLRSHTRWHLGEVTTNDLQARIRAVIARAHDEAQAAAEHERTLDARSAFDTGDSMMTRVNHRASAIAWTTVANALTGLLDESPVTATEPRSGL